MSQYTISNNTNSFNNVSNTFIVADGRPQLLTWLSPLEPGLRHSDIQERRVNDIGEWLMQTEEFRGWCGLSGEGEGDKAVLFCYGDPGVGKTFISSLVVDRLCDQVRGQNIVVACFYFDFAARKEQSATSMLGSLLKQMINGMERVPEEISRALRERKIATSERSPQLDDIVKILQLITSTKRTFMCIDALDECAGVQRVRLLDSLKKIVENSPGSRIFVTGRPHIRAEIEKRLPGRVLSVSVGPKRDDLIRYLRARLGEDETPDAMDESLEADILEKIPESLSEMFLLVSLNIEAILQESTIYRRRERLSKITGRLVLGDVYDAMIERITTQGGDKSRLGMEALMWVTHAERPLRADELCHALAIELGSRNFNTTNVPSVSTLLSCCQGLITVDKKGSTVRLIHFTLQEYLSAHPNIFSGPHSSMAEVCLTYLNSEQIKALSPDLPPDTQNMPFLEYCSLHWGAHAKKELSDSARSLALELLLDYHGHVSAKLIFEQPEYRIPSPFGFWFSGIHCASFFGVTLIVALLARLGRYDINQKDFWGFTPLTWAARNGHDETVNMLLGWKEVNPNNPDNSGRTPLSYAAVNGHEGIVKMLLGQEKVRPDEPDNFGRTPLYFAAGHGREGVVKILLGCEKVGPDKPDFLSRTPLLAAAENGREGIVKMLLGRKEVNPDKPCDLGRTPLSCAAKNGYEGVVKVLLGRGEVNPDRPDNSGRTPLWNAVEYGREGAVKMLLGRGDVNPDRPNDSGRTPLSRAAEAGREVMVKILLQRKEVHPDKPDNGGRTPLSFAAEGGDEGVVKILLGREEVNPKKPDRDGRTPVRHAAKNGHREVVKILLARITGQPRQSG